MVSEGLWFNEETTSVDNAHIRMLFIDVLTRRFLLRSITILTLIKQRTKKDRWDVVKLMTRDFEQYRGLPKWAKSSDYIDIPEHWQLLESEICKGLHRFDTRQKDKEVIVDGAILSPEDKMEVDRIKAEKMQRKHLNVTPFMNRLPLFRYAFTGTKKIEAEPAANAGGALEEAEFDIDELYVPAKNNLANSNRKRNNNDED